MMTHPLRQTLRSITTVGVWLFAFMLLLVYSKATHKIDSVIFDQLSGISRSVAHDDILMIGIDEDTIKQEGNLPWSNAQYEKFFKQLSFAAPQSILFTLPTLISANNTWLKQTQKKLPNIYIPEQNFDNKNLLKTKYQNYQMYTGFDQIFTDEDGVVRYFFNKKFQQEDTYFLPYYAYHHQNNIDLNTKLNKYLFNYSKTPVAYLSYDAFMQKTDVEFLKGKHIIIGLARFGDKMYRLSDQNIYTAMEIYAQVMHSSMHQQNAIEISTEMHCVIGICIIFLTLLMAQFINPKLIAYLIAGMVVLCLFWTWVGLNYFQLWYPPFSTIALMIFIYPLFMQNRMHHMQKFIDLELSRLKKNGALHGLFQLFDTKAHQPSKILNNSFDQRLFLFRESIARLDDMRQFMMNNLNAFPDAIFVIDVKCNIKIFNKAAQSWFNQLECSTEHNLSETLDYLAKKNILVCESIKNWLDLLSYLKNESHFSENGLYIKLFKGRFEYVHMRLVPSTNSYGIVVSYLCIFHDMTQQRLAEGQRDEMMRFLSHDMRAPQSSILATIQIQRKQLTYSDEQESILSKIESYAYRTLNLAEEFVQMSKAEGKKYQFHDVNMANLMMDVVDDMWPLANKKQLHIHQHLDEEIYIMGDKVLLSRVFMNILSNAIKYSAENKNIRIHLYKQLKREDGKEWAMCNIIDEGPGISDQNQKKLFQRYERFTEEKNTEGIGLGLVFVKTVVDGHAGRISCKSKLGYGTAFMVELPLADE